MIDQEQRREFFNMACELLGGQRTTARILKVTDRTVRSLCAGDSAIKLGFMRDITAALRTRGEACRALAAKTDPLFNANLTADEIRQRPQAKEARRG